MPEEATTNITDEFEHYCSILKSELSYVEDGSFSWDDVVGLLVIQLKNTDSLNYGSSLYDTKEMGILIDKALDWASELDINTEYVRGLLSEVDNL